ncbi:MATE family efflux transporter [Paenibacillus baekrokdamisoli]|uniref:MATE family efflux transporter n=1 Tax=Paenibacillus baekrokdamisoli TaxID=1712516 RepID=A0A3G9J300_9BACL|nr:putative MATE family efflux protein [Paenibacillus baekrokdamisoli]BBH22715.1 MATE family efflux transporter [Paenibacillus baekrokdamisoli]
MKNRSNLDKFSLWLLAWPIFIEVFLQTLLGTVDTLMVSRISDDAVAVVGFSNQLFNALTTLFITIAGGAGILIAQKLGSKRTEDARTIAVIAVKASGMIGLLISIVLYLQPHFIARLLNLPEHLLPLSDTYISIAGGGMVLSALMAALSTVIRNTGNTRGPMYTAVGINIIHVLLNYGFIFGAFGFPQWGLTGVSISTLVSRLLAVLLLFYMFIHSFERKVGLADIRLKDSKLFKEVLRIGWPLGVNMSCWVFSQLVIYTFLATLGTKELAARTYMNTLESFCFMLGYAFALAAQIQIAHLYGAKRTKEAYKSAYKALYVGLIVVSFNALLLYLLGKRLLGLFTDDKEIIAMGISLLALNFLLQPGKMINMALGNALNAVGDTRYMMVISIASMGIVATGCSYLFGIHLGWGLIGIYCCMIADEYVRGFLVFIRWRDRKVLRKIEASQGDSLSGQQVHAVRGVRLEA